MNIPSLIAFINVAQTNSFSKAADALFLTQPAVSKRIAHLENELDTRLFDRIGRQLVLTEAGRFLLPSAQRICRELEETKRALADLSGQVTGSLRLATSHHIGLYHLPHYLKEYSRAFPRVDLDLHFMDSESACEAVENGSIEVGIVTLSQHPSATLLSQVIWKDALSVVVGHAHELNKSRNIDPTEVLAFPAILPGSNTTTRKLIDDAFAPWGIPKVKIATNNLETIKMMVSIGLGWSALPKSMLSKHVNVLCLNTISISRNLGIVLNKNITMSNAAKALINTVNGTLVN